MTTPEGEHDPGMKAVAEASDDLIAMTVQRHAEADVLREARAVITNAEWNALTPQEQETRLAEQDAAYDAYAAERAAEVAAEAEPEAGS